jgi:hypothetical protein
MEDDALIERLLYSGEGDTLDFKLKQYPFENADDKSKSSLLKDILAFANAWRTTTAYILIGVRDGTGEIVGVDNDIDDSRLQQFVNGKVNQPVQFSYRSLDFKAHRLGLYTIPVQERPIFAVKAYGKVKADTVYVRRGSSMAEAKPDEIAKMGASTPAQAHSPRLSIKVVLKGDDEIATEVLEAAMKNVNLPDDKSIPDYPEPDPNGGYLGGFGQLIDLSGSKNRNFYRDVGRFIRERSGLVGFKLKIENVGDAYADDVKITLSVPLTDGFKLASCGDLMDKPKRNLNLVIPREYRNGAPPKVRLSSNDGVQTATFFVGKIQAGDVAHTESIFFTNPTECLSEMKIRVHADQFKAPLELIIPVLIRVEDELLTTEQIKGFADKKLKEVDW